jgi:hypothetical protein
MNCVAKHSEKQNYLYKKIDHLKEKLFQFQQNKSAKIRLCKITGSLPITLTKETETIIINMFQSMQEPLKKYSDHRSNFLSYSYVLNKLFGIINLEHHSKFYSLLESKEKLRDHDNIWEKICRDMEWKFISSIDEKLNFDYSIDQHKILPKIEIRDDFEINL